MMPKIKNAILFTGIALALILAYVFFFKDNGEESGNLVSVATTATGTLSTTVAVDENSPGKDFLPILLNVNNIKLDDSIFSDPAFMNLVDGSLVLVPEGDEGRQNPFAPLGAENYTATRPASSSPTSPNPSTPFPNPNPNPSR